jgi:hypothetical protein
MLLKGRAAVTLSRGSFGEAIEAGGEGKALVLI